MDVKLPRQLTRREAQVYRLLLLGKSNKEIAAELTLSVSAVKFHITNIFEKHRVHSRLELLANECQRYSPSG